MSIKGIQCEKSIKSNVQSGSQRKEGKQCVWIAQFWPLTVSADVVQALVSSVECGFAKDTCCLFMACCCCTNTSLSLLRKMILAIIIAKGCVCTDGLISGSLVLHGLGLCSVNTNFLLTPCACYDKGPSHFVWPFLVDTSSKVCISLLSVILRKA